MYWWWKEETNYIGLKLENLKASSFSTTVICTTQGKSPWQCQVPKWNCNSYDFLFLFLFYFKVKLNFYFKPLNCQSLSRVICLWRHMLKNTLSHHFLLPLVQHYCWSLPIFACQALQSCISFHYFRTTFGGTGRYLLLVSIIGMVISTRLCPRRHNNCSVPRSLRPSEGST